LLLFLLFVSKSKTQKTGGGYGGTVPAALFWVSVLVFAAQACGPPVFALASE
jgi:hypothetical protein